jgi:hypothetical protein
VKRLDRPAGAPAAAAVQRCDVSLVGKAKLGGLTLDKIARNGYKRTLPLLPSDHFGLAVNLLFAESSPAVRPPREADAEKPPAADGQNKRKRNGGAGGSSFANPIELD